MSIYIDPPGQSTSQKNAGLDAQTIELASKKLYEMGIFASPDIDAVANEIPFAKAAILYIAGGESPTERSLRILEIMAAIGIAANSLKDHSLLGLGDKDIDQTVQDAASIAGLTDKSVTTGIMECLGYWNQPNPTISVAYRMGNLMLITGAIAEAINDPDKLIR